MTGISRKISAGLGCVAIAGALAISGVGTSGPIARGGEARPEADHALERARDVAKMLDALYKNAVVSITNKYNKPPAIRVAQELFGAMEKGGWHKAKLVDATGEPQNEANRPQTPFEKRAEAAIKAGQPYYEEVSGHDEDRTLYVATVVPAVLNKCASCHGVEKGDLLGFIRYEIPVK